MIFKRKAKRNADRVESCFQQGLSLVKDLDRTEFNRFIDGLTLAWQGYDRIRRVQTIDEKENGDPDIDKAEKILAKESKKTKGGKK